VEECVHKFSDFAADDEMPIEGEKVRIEAILNKSIVITKCKIRNSKYKKDNCDRCASVQFYEVETPSRKEMFFTGSNVIIDLLEKYGDKIPFETVIKKIDKYYTLT
jgi:hypothetical protein